MALTKINLMKVWYIILAQFFLLCLGYAIGSFFIFAENHRGEFVAYGIAAVSSFSAWLLITKLAWRTPPYKECEECFEKMATLK